MRKLKLFLDAKAANPPPRGISKASRVIFSVLTLLLLSIGQVWATETELFSQTYPGSPSTFTNNYTGSFTITTSGYTLTYANINNGQSSNNWDALRCGRGSNNASVATITSGQISTAVSSVSITFTQVNASKTNKLYLEVASNSSFTSPTKINATIAAEEINFPITSPAANQYYRIVIDLQANTNGFTRFSSVTFFQNAGGTPTCATPTFSPKAGAVLSGTEVSISCATDGASIHYTTDGSDPTASSATYSGTITIDAAKTIKAIAVKDGYDNSDVATAAYTIATPYTSIASLANDMTNSDQIVYVTFGGWQVSVVKNSQAFVTDGTNGLIIYQSGHGLVEGDILTGTVQCTLVSYNGVVELKGVTKTMDGITVTSGTISPVVKTIAEANDLTALNTGLLIKLENVTYNGTAFVDAGSNTIAPYTSFYDYSSVLESGKKYNVVGIVQQYQSNSQIYPRKQADIEEVVEEGAPEAPTFSPAAGEYTAVQTVELSCATDGATIYYTTNGDTPDNTSTEYLSAITVDETMTIKAIAIKNEKSSSVATAEYTINLPENEEVRKTWDLSTDSYDADPTEDLIQWSVTYVTMTNAKGTGTKVNNYIPTTRTSTRFYAGNSLTITPNGKSLTTIVFTATSTSYATALANSTWTNATAVASGSTVTVTATDGDAAVSAVIGATCGFTAVQVNYITDIRVAAGLAWSTDEVEITLGELFSAPTLNNPNSIAAGEITIESNNTALATVAGGVVSLVENATGTATITASFAGNASYKATEVSYMIKVNKPLSPWASVYTSNVTLSTEGGTSASAAKVIFDETEGGYDAIKAGTGNVFGAVKVTVPAQATALHYHAYGWNGEDVTLSITAPEGVTINPESQAIISNAGIKSNTPFTLENDPDPKNDAYYAVELSGNDEEIELTFTATGNKRFVIFGVNQEGGIVPELQSIEIAGDLTTKSYKAGDALDLDGLTVNAIYSLGGTPQTPVDITDDAELEWSYAPLVENQTSITITATYKGQTDDITINDLVVTSADPKIYVSTLNVNFASVEVGDAVPAAETITISLTNVAAVTATLGGTNPEAFSISKTEGIVDGDVITISVASTSTLGSYSATITITDNAGLAPQKVVNLSLNVEEVETPVSTTSQWVAATDADLVDGAEVLITGVKNEAIYAMGGQNTNNRAAVEASVDGEGILTPGENTMAFTLVATGTANSYYIMTSNNQYLYNASSSTKSYLRTQTTEASWTITLDADNNAVITSVENTNRQIMRFNYNGGSPLFNCYASGQDPIKLYVPKQDTPVEPTSEDVRTELEINRYYTICLPKNVTAATGATFWSLTNRNAAETEVYLEEVTLPLEAGKPYIFRATAETLNVTYGDETAANPGENGALRGTFENLDADALAAKATHVYILIQNSIRPAGGENSLKANRAYIDYDALTPGYPAPGRRVVAMPMQGQTATGCENIQAGEAPVKMMIDGQLFILRGEKMYDTTGRLVK